MDNNHQQIAILDFGSQYTHLIARRFRQLKVLAKIYPADYDVSQVANLIGIVLSGGPGSVDNSKYRFKDNIFTLGIPVLGLCFGHQLIAQILGGQVKFSGSGEYGKAQLNIKFSSLFAGLSSEEMVWMSHGDSVFKLPQGFKIIGTTSDQPIAAMENATKKIYGLQFHPEVTHTTNGLKILENFAITICQADGDWDAFNLQAELIRQIQEKVERKKVFLLVSGGVDSTTTFALLEKALGKDRVYGLYIDTGMMRLDETNQIKSLLNKAGFDNLHIKDAANYFVSELQGVIDPEEKRKIIGQTFLKVKDQVASDMGLNTEEWLLGQGTIYPDTIETGGTKHADTIKTHHNRVDAILELIKQGRVIEPIKDFYKDEVRDLGRSLGLAEEIVNRHPFPGPGLGIRVLCSDGKSSISSKQSEKLNKKVKEIVDSFYESNDIDSYVLPIRSVGVQGDYRTYAQAAVLHVSEYKWNSLGELSSQLTNFLPDINRVLVEVGCFTDKASSQKSGPNLMALTITQKRLDELRKIDALVHEEIRQAGLYEDIWQFPVVLIPFGTQGKESIVLRPVVSLEAMTARFYSLPTEIINSIIYKIKSLGTISYVYYDLTNKPPGTIEWE